MSIHYLHTHPSLLHHPLLGGMCLPCGLAMTLNSLSRQTSFHFKASLNLRVPILASAKHLICVLQLTLIRKSHCLRRPIPHTAAGSCHDPSVTGNSQKLLDRHTTSQKQSGLIEIIKFLKLGLKKKEAEKGEIKGGRKRGRLGNRKQCMFGACVTRD